MQALDLLCLILILWDLMSDLNLRYVLINWICYCCFHSLSLLTLHSTLLHTLFFLSLLISLHCIPLHCITLSLKLHFPPPFKGFEDLGFGMNLRSILNLTFPLNICLMLICCMPRPFFSLAACEFHGKCKRFDLISLTFQNPFISATKMIYI